MFVGVGNLTQVRCVLRIVPEQEVKHVQGTIMLTRGEEEFCAEFGKCDNVPMAMRKVVSALRFGIGGRVNGTQCLILGVVGG